jgi:hypothetical protein
LTLQGDGWLTDRYVLEEGMDGSQTVVSCPRAVAAVGFEVLEELPQERNIEIFKQHFGRRPPEALTAELEQQPKGISVRRYGILARPELLEQSLGEETLHEGLQAGNAHRSPPG